MAKKPNILYFVADQMRADAQHYLGNTAAITPNFDALAGEGVAFQNAYCQNPVCVPSRCSFLSGLYPHTTGHRTMHFLQHEEGPTHTRAMMIRMGNLKYTMRLYERDTLYDLDLDPHEQVNRIDDPAYAERVAEMRERILTWYQETADWVPNRKDMR